MSQLYPLGILAIGLAIATLCAIWTGYVPYVNRFWSGITWAKRSTHPVYYWFLVAVMAFVAAICAYYVFALD
jgi:hypothetical protein